MEKIAPKHLTAEAVDRLCAYPWPGNVRELENAIEMAVALSGDRGRLEADDFPLAAPLRMRSQQMADLPLVPVPDQGLDYDRTLAEIERSILGQALRKTGGNKQAAADMLCLKRTTLAAKLRTLEAMETVH
jgi:DNA-binding NtrC family response regulator